MLLSIIIPVYNHAKALERCIESILTQSFSNSPAFAPRQDSGTTAGRQEFENGGVEAIVVNDGSQDKILEMRDGILEQMTSRGFLVQWIDQENKGAAAARNRGFDASSGEYLFFCDADLRLKPTCLEKMMAALNADRQAAFCYCQFKLGWKTFTSFPFDRQHLQQLNYIHTSSLIRREWFPRFDETLKKFQDWDLFLTVAEKGGRGVFIPEVLYTIATGGTMSRWVPSWAYRWPWKELPWWKKAVHRYQQSRAILRQKHSLTRAP